MGRVAPAPIREAPRARETRRKLRSKEAKLPRLWEAVGGGEVIKIRKKSRRVGVQGSGSRGLRHGPSPDAFLGGRSMYSAASAPEEINRAVQIAGCAGMLAENCGGCMLVQVNLFSRSHCRGLVPPLLSSR